MYETCISTQRRPSSGKGYASSDLPQEVLDAIRDFNEATREADDLWFRFTTSAPAVAIAYNVAWLALLSVTDAAGLDRRSWESMVNNGTGGAAELINFAGIR